MKRIAPLILILTIAVILMLGIIPGCDKLVTNETTLEYHDTVRDSACLALCHSDNNMKMIAAELRWANSGHADSGLVDTTLFGKNTITCGQECHTNEGYIKAVDSIAGNTYLTEYPTPVGCFTCHAPHTTWDFSLRDQTAIALVGGSNYNNGASNQCVYCHHSLVNKSDLIHDSTIIETNVINGWDTLMMHGMGEADLLLGKGGFEHNFDSVTWVWSSSHSHTTTESQTCISCHQDSTGNFTLGGHSLNITNNSGALVEACNITGCHSGTPAQISAQTIAAGQALIETRLSDLKAGLGKLGLLNVETGLPDTTILIIDSNITGALYNYFYIRHDKSRGMHDFVYDTLLLRASIDYLAGALPPPKRAITK
jgi:hypothetical protein